MLEGNVTFFRSLLPECEKHEVGIAIENIFDSAAGGRGAPRFYGAVPEELCELVDALNHPLIGACWDTGHAHIQSLDQRAALAALGSRLKALHIQENDGKGDDHMLPFANGRKGVDWTAVTAGLAEAAYEGPFTYEVHNAFNAVPPSLYDQVLHQSVTIARYLIAQVQGGR